MVGGILCDPEKAFDCVSHDIFFLSKLNFCGITSKENSLFKFYFTDRYQRVIIYNVNFNHNAISSWEEK